ncbi:MAG: hypothetical protein QX199_20730 [Methylococcaceae bacterium]
MAKIKVSKEKGLEILNEKLQNHPDFKSESSLKFLKIEEYGITSTLDRGHSADESELMQRIQREFELSYEFDKDQD